MSDLQNNIWFWLAIMVVYFGLAVTLSLTVQWWIGVVMAMVFIIGGSLFFFIPRKR